MYKLVTLDRQQRLSIEPILCTGNVQVSDVSAHTMFSDEESLEVIVPRPDGPGKCTNNLVKYLVDVHNEFIETCMATVKQRYMYWYQNGVPCVFVEFSHSDCLLYFLWVADMFMIVVSYHVSSLHVCWCSGWLCKLSSDKTTELKNDLSACEEIYLLISLPALGTV